MGFVSSCKYFEEELGALVCVTVRRNSRSMRARLVGTEYRVSVPGGTTVEDYMRFIEQIKSKLAPKMAAHMRFEPGMTLEGLMIRVEIVEEASVPFGEIRTGGSVEADGTTLLRFVVAEGTAPEKYQRAVNRHILTRACAVAERVFRPYVFEAVARVGLRERVKGVSFNTNRSNYGLCYRDGRIEFSSRLLFYPAELRELVVMHELAHLTYPDHSEAFHTLVNDYLGGRERELERKLRAFRTPLF